MKKLYLIAAVFAFIALLTGIPYMIDGIRERGIDGVNYGRMLFPAIICALSLWFYRKYIFFQKTNPKRGISPWKPKRPASPYGRLPA